MKRSCILNVAIIVIFCCTGIALSDNRKSDAEKGIKNKQQYSKSHQGEKERSDYRGNEDSKNRHQTYRHGDINKRPDYHSHTGYRERPYQKNRHYAHHDHRGHRYEYQGHWKSWKQWDSYAKAHPDIYKHGDYYRENAHLMFRFRDPVTGGYFFFSIGR